MIDKKKKVIMIEIITVLIIVTLSLLGVTYAYYRTRIVGNSNDKSISVTSKKLEITYMDGTSEVNMEGSIKPGFSYIKTFSVENTGSETLNYSIILDNVTNTFKRTEDWTYALTNAKTNEKITGNVFRLSEQTLLANISIDSKKIDSYKLEVTYEQSSEDQSVDMGKLMSFRVNIKEASEWDKAEEGTLLYALKNDALNEVVDPVTVPGKAPSGVTYAEEDGESGTNSISAWHQKYAYYAYSSTYTFDEESGTYSLDNPKVATYSEISSNLVNKYVTSLYPDSSKTITTEGKYEIYKITSAPPASTSSVKIGYTRKKVGTGKVAEAVFSSTEDDYGISYYFRGNVENNYVNYSGMCWRIVRVQGDGTIKLALADEKGECNSIAYNENNVLSAFIEGRVDIPYDKLDYKFWEPRYIDSNILVVLNEWAKKQVIAEDGTVLREHNLDISRLASIEWCRDLSISSSSKYGEELGYVYQEIYYGTSYRSLRSEKTAELSLKCTSMKNIANIGILSADEVLFAGATPIGNLESNYYYLKNNATGNQYWTLTPYFSLIAKSEMDANSHEVWIVNSFGTLSVNDVGEFGSVRPVIALKPHVTLDTSIMGQNGTQTNPYVIS